MNEQSPYRRVPLGLVPNWDQLDLLAGRQPDLDGIPLFKESLPLNILESLTPHLETSGSS